jgi:hypothetical protein
MAAGSRLGLEDHVVLHACGVAAVGYVCVRTVLLASRQWLLPAVWSRAVGPARAARQTMQTTVWSARAHAHHNMQARTMQQRGIRVPDRFYSAEGKLIKLLPPSDQRNAKDFNFHPLRLTEANVLIKFR